MLSILGTFGTVNPFNFSHSGASEVVLNLVLISIFMIFSKHKETGHGPCVCSFGEVPLHASCLFLTSGLTSCAIYIFSVYSFPFHSLKGTV